VRILNQLLPDDPTRRDQQRVSSQLCVLGLEVQQPHVGEYKVVVLPPTTEEGYERHELGIGRIRREPSDRLRIEDGVGRGGSVRVRDEIRVRDE
jgi:hypothetical protein